MMTNEEKYNFKDFTFEQYRLLIKLAKENHPFIFYSEMKDQENFALWRHDIDMSVENALGMSKIEKEMGVKATYFVHLHSNFYNFFDHDKSKSIRQIVENGHQLGLHLDCDFYTITNEQSLEDAILFEKQILEKTFQVNIDTFSYHNPTEKILAYNKDTYAGLINTYGTRFKEVGYCSDSNGYWRHKSIREFLENSRNIPVQVLTHPEWWNKEIMSPKQRIWKCVDDHAADVKKKYSDGLEAYGRENIDWN